MIFPTTDEVFKKRGACYLKIKDYKRAAADFQKAIEALDTSLQEQIRARIG